MNIKYIIRKKEGAENLLALNEDFPELYFNSFEYSELGEFIIAQYKEDGESYVEITLSPEEIHKLCLTYEIEKSFVKEK